MEKISISDVTMKEMDKKAGADLTFKGKIEIAKLLDRLGVSVIELEALRGSRADALRVKSIASAVRDSTLALPAGLSAAEAEAAWDALRSARHPRLQVAAPVSTVQMEYLSHRKPEAILAAIGETVAVCAGHTPDVEFLAEDATRSDESFLRTAIETAIGAGATTVTVCDASGTMLPEEIGAFLRALLAEIPALSVVRLGVSCANTMAMADACAVAAVTAGAREIKVSAVETSTASLQNTARILSAREELFGVSCPLHMVELRRLSGQVERICQNRRSKTSPFEDGVQDTAPDLQLAISDSVEEVTMAARQLGYELSGEDGHAVWEAVQDMLRHKDALNARELDAIIASVALQVPPTYLVESYLINSGNNISAVAHLKLSRHGQTMEGVALGDGPIDAAFLAIEQILHHHYELDDFQIRAVTEGHEAMGETVVRLLSNGKLYSGRGISMDIVGSSIQAYINALNKIAYEEAEA